MALHLNEELVRDLQARHFQQCGEGWFRILSGSMRPLIDAGDMVLVRKIDLDDLNSGDIILFTHNSVNVTHRIIKQYSRYGRIMALQKGDANVHAGEIERETILGRVVAINKKGKVLPLDKGALWGINALYSK